MILSHKHIHLIAYAIQYHLSHLCHLHTYRVEMRSWQTPCDQEGHVLHHVIQTISHIRGQIHALLEAPIVPSRHVHLQEELYHRGPDLYGERK